MPTIEERLAALELFVFHPKLVAAAPQGTVMARARTIVGESADAQLAAGE